MEAAPSSRRAGSGCAPGFRRGAWPQDGQHSRADCRVIDSPKMPGNNCTVDAAPYSCHMKNMRHKGTGGVLQQIFKPYPCSMCWDLQTPNESSSGCGTSGICSPPGYPRRVPTWSMAIHEMIRAQMVPCGNPLQPSHASGELIIALKQQFSSPFGVNPWVLPSGTSFPSLLRRMKSGAAPRALQPG